ncbi:MOSC domain-containing protein [Pseudohongiella acticola]|jgi:MOSC domain|uniref:MOSC domain-containing protein n=1 Tax=Pseudohongiella acticola TaxID=1524254 RepID=UPI0030EE17F2
MNVEMYLSEQELKKGFQHIQGSPPDNGLVEMIVCRPDTGERSEMQSCELDREQGLIGDNWLARGYKKTADGSAHPDMQINIMNARAAALVAGSRDRWKLAGDQLYIDMDLSADNLPPGTQLQVGDAIVQVTGEPHLGCKKFMERFGRDATLFVNSEQGRLVNMRGINARVIKSGRVNVGDKAVKF